MKRDANPVKTRSGKIIDDAPTGPHVPIAIPTVALVMARGIADSLRATSQGYHDGSVTYEQMGERNRADWNKAERHGIVDEVSRILRETPHTPLQRRAT